MSKETNLGIVVEYKLQKSGVQKICIQGLAIHKYKSISKRKVGNMLDLIIDNSEMSAVLGFESTLTHQVTGGYR